MSIRAISGKGVNRAECVCDDCGKSESVTCDYERGAGNKWAPNEGQVKKKITAQGWFEVKGKLRCPACEKKRKVIPMQTKQDAAKDAGDLRQPTREQKREIMLLLGDVYDCDGGCYRGDETDQTVADTLSVMPGWVAELREEFFGPEGSNADMAALHADLCAFLDRSEKQVADLTGVVAEARALQQRLEKITKAVGPRVMARVGK
ncbi:hypothetical protein [Salipiger abyssi]|uniref:Uncharacterized protein n=1 Tax=Salipiger abyssi TaxID=1250539 RepID=A0A1P8UWG5_9RHOB|nr:hypothetical protein [Salipiger abyssi]APZ53729.1 hypothetical protein Ga0080574_TMP3395 [Salipiger abyssi]